MIVTRALARLPAQRGGTHKHNARPMIEVIALQNAPLEERTSAGHCPRWVLLRLLPSSASHHALNQVLEMNFFKHVPLAECAFPRPGLHPVLLLLSQ